MQQHTQTDTRYALNLLAVDAAFYQGEQERKDTSCFLIRKMGAGIAIVVRTQNNRDKNVSIYDDCAVF